ncbi:MAG: four-carbon acid sugar kinase family protein [SAR202 cluster bacterium]|nr:four-carbon acid sugar kinase family protein [SAR202 cluster bacterium]
MSQTRIGVVADDLTGALDTAGAFASRGLRSRVLTAPADKMDARFDGDVAIVNTHTRNVDAALAIAPAHRAAKELSDSGWSRLYKKVDSTARGNLAAECKAVMDAQEAVAAIVCPAFPRMGRTVVDGILMVNGAPVTQSIEGSDDLSAVPSDSLLELMTLEEELTPGLVPLSVVREGVKEVRSKVSKLIERGCNALVIDAETDSDLQTIAEYSKGCPDYLLVGSAGLAYAVGNLFRRDNEFVIGNIRTNSPLVIVAGSRHQATRVQVEAISSAGVAEVISLNPEPALGERMERIGYSREVMVELERCISAGRNVVLEWDQQARHPDPVSQEEATTLANFAGLLVYGIARRAYLGGLIIAGGDTAFGVLRALGASTVDVLGELEAGAPLGSICDGIGAGLTLVTKAGGFGDEGLFVRALEAIGPSGAPSS